MARNAIVAALLVAVVAGCGTCGDKHAGGSSDAQMMPGLVATCAFAEGEVLVRRVGQVYWEPVTTGTAFRSGDWVRTGKLGKARIEYLGGGSGLDIEEDATIVLDAATDENNAAPQPIVALEYGVVSTTATRNAANPEKPQVGFRTAQGNILHVVPETDEEAAYRVSREGDSTDVAVSKGTAKVKIDGKPQVVVAAGQFTRVRNARAEKPRSQIEFPTSLEPGIDARTALGAPEPVRMRWSEVAGATGYKIQVGRDLSFRKLFVSEVTKDLSYDFRPRLQGTYVWRVASRDGDKRFGEFGFARRIFCEPEGAADLLLAPVEGEAVSAKGNRLASVTFSWQSVTNAPKYRIVIATKPDLKRGLVAAREVTAQQVILSTLQPGTFYWGVYVARDGGKPLFVKPRKLVVLPPSGPGLKTPRNISEWGR